VANRLDPTGVEPDDEPILDWDYESRTEFLDQIECNLDDGLVPIADEVWYVEDDAIAEVGAAKVAQLRADMRAYLETARAEVEEEHT
jgi:hypothetical protein